MKIKVVAFDWNGTLVNDPEWVFEGVKEIFRHFGKPIPQFDEYRREMGGDYIPFYQKRGITGSRELLNEIMGKKLSTLPPPTLFSDTRATLQFFKNHGTRLALISLREDAALRADLNSHGLTQFFGFTSGGVTKKDAALRKLMRTFVVIPQEVVYVGDTAQDVVAAKKVKVCAVAIPRGFNSPKQLMSAKPDLFVENLNALTRILGHVL